MARGCGAESARAAAARKRIEIKRNAPPLPRPLPQRRRGRRIRLRPDFIRYQYGYFAGGEFSVMGLGWAFSQVFLLTFLVSWRKTKVPRLLPTTTSGYFLFRMLPATT